MNRVRLSVMTAALLLVPVLAGCGDTAPDASDEGTSATPGASAGAALSDVATPEGVDFAARTMTKSALSAEQAVLHDELILFEETALDQVGENFGGSTGGFTDEAGDTFNLPRPEGIRLATAYEIEWAEGAVTRYSLATESGDQLRWDGGKVYVDLAIDSPKDQDLESDLATLATAIDDWEAEHGAAPSLSESFGVMVLEPGMTDESDAEEVEVELGETIKNTGYARFGDEFEVKFTSTDTGEVALLSHEGMTFTTPLEVV